MTGLSSYLLILTLKINGLNPPTRKMRLGEWIQNEDPKIRHLQKNNVRNEDKQKLKMKGWNKTHRTN